MNKDLYEILGVEPSATDNEIKKAYRKLSMEYHPDRNENKPEYVEKFQEINNAYSILEDKQSRKKYDYEKQFSDTNLDFDINDLFSNIFNSSINTKIHPFMNIPTGGNVRIFTSKNGFSQENMPNTRVNFGFHPQMNNIFNKPEIISKTVEINMNQSYSGCSIPVIIERITIYNNEKRLEQETIYVKIPQGIDDNEIITISEKGNIVNNIKGDIKIIIKIKNSTNLERKGLDILYKQTITLKEALCGVCFDLPHLNGKIYKINNDVGSIIQPGYKKIIPNMGFKRENDIGNLIIEFLVQFPEKINKEDINKLKDIL